MGPTASGKTELALKLAKEFPLDLISVDSALVYRGMNIGTAKPDAETLRQVPHHLIDIRDPEESYSAGEFVRDACREIDASKERRHIPLLVGGTMMYFRALTEGIADLPVADVKIRAAIDAEAEAHGWPALHAELADVDETAAARINPNDSQRIQRALEVYRISGKSLSKWQAGAASSIRKDRYLKVAIITESRAALQQRIALRLQDMMANGFVEEVESLMARPGLTANHPSMRAVGYRQIWSFLEGKGNLEEATQKALAATRQLAKRQLTWLRSERQATVVDPLEADALATISTLLSGHLER
jgi:tRNA dimethylallyltransferase